MKKIIFVIIVVLCQSCWICPEKQSLEFTKSTKTIKILSEHYYIKSIRVTEYLPKKNFIELIDSNYVEFNQIGPRGAYEMSLDDIGENYWKKGNSNAKELLNKKYLEYIIKIEKVDPEKKNDDSDRDVIRFVSSELEKEKNVMESNHPCP